MRSSPGEGRSSFGVLVVEDHDGMRDALGESIARMDGFHLTDSVDRGELALEVIPERRPDAVLIDMSLPGMSGTELVAAITERWPEVRCIIISGHREPHYVDESRAAGARGYVVKGRPAEVGASLTSVLRGDTYFSDTIR